MNKHNRNGFTLIEVIIVIAILGIGLAFAIPNIMDMGVKGQLRTAVRQLKDQMAQARITAIETNAQTLIAFDPFVDGVITSYQIVQDADGDCEIDVGEQSRRISLSNVNITANNLTANDAGNLIVQWDNRGYPRRKNGSFTNGTVTFSGGGNQLQVLLSPTGNIRITTP